MFAYFMTSFKFIDSHPVALSGHTDFSVLYDELHFFAFTDFNKEAVLEKKKEEKSDIDLFMLVRAL